MHALASASPDIINLSCTDRIMPVVPLFHANGWSIGYTAPLVGASMVMPGREMAPESLYEMLEKGVTVTAAVPTIWLLLLNYLKANKLRLSSLKRVIIGGSSCPRAVIESFQTDFGIQVLHAWGMTEMSPLGTICSFKPEVLELSEEEKISIQETTGHPPFTVELKLTDDAGNKLTNDGDILMNYLHIPMSNPFLQKIGFLFCTTRGVHIGGNSIARKKSYVFANDFMMKTLIK